MNAFQTGKHCGDHEALVAYLYDECEPADRDAVAAHLAQCAACAEEIASLRATRTQLTAWAPPDARLGFQVTSADQRNEPIAADFARATAERARGPWWRAPLPAWAQMAAAALIFAAGLTAGSLGRSSVSGTAATVAAPAAARTAPAVAAPVSATELARLEQRLLALEAARTQRVASVPASAEGPGVDERALLARAQALVDARVAASEAKLNQDIEALAQATNNVDAQYRRLAQRVNRTYGVGIEDLQEARTPATSLGRRVSFGQ